MPLISSPGEICGISIDEVWYSFFNFPVCPVLLFDSLGDLFLKLVDRAVRVQEDSSFTVNQHSVGDVLTA